jgi:hypothetical protein
MCGWPSADYDFCPFATVSIAAIGRKARQVHASDAGVREEHDPRLRLVGDAERGDHWWWVSAARRQKAERRRQRVRLVLGQPFAQQALV